MNISFEKACNIINENKVERVYCIEESKEKDYGKPKGKGVDRTSIAFFECGCDVGVKSIAPMIFIRKDEILKVNSKDKELGFDFNDGMKYRVVLS